MAREKIILDIQAEVAKAKKDIKSLQKSVGGVNKEVKQTDQLFQKAAGTFAALFSVAAIVGFTKKIIEVRAEFEKYNAVLKNTLGSAQAASIEFERIQKFASETPFSVRELTSAFVKLVNQGFKPTVAELRKLGDVAAATGKDFDQLTEAIIDATVGEFERLKEFGIRAQKAGDQVTFTFKEVETQVKFTSESIRDYILSLGDLEGVSGAMAEISETLGGKISNLGDNWDSLLDTLGGRTSGLFSAVIGGLNRFITAAERAGKTVAQLKEEVALLNLGREQELSLEEFLGFVEIAKQEGETYLEVAERFLEVDKQRIDIFLDLNQEAEGFRNVQKRAGGSTKELLTEEERLRVALLQERVRAILDFARAEDRAEQARINKRIEEEFKAAQKVAKEWEKSFDKQMTDAENWLQAVADGNDILTDKIIDNLDRTTEANRRALEEGEEDEQRDAALKLQMAEFLKDQKLQLATEVLRTGSRLAEEGTALQKTLAIAEVTISGITATQKAYEWGMESGGPVVAGLAAAAAAIVGILNLALVSGVTFAEGGYTGKSKLPAHLSDKHGRIAGLVHEDEFVFNRDKTAKLRPLFEDIHNDRIDARGLAALTRRGVIVPMVNNNFNSKILENEVSKIYQQIRSKDPERYIERTERGYIKKTGNTTIIAN